MTSRTAHWQAARLLQAEETHIRSKHTGRSYRIQTAAIGSPPPQGYPVLHILDGDAFFPAALSMAQSLLINPMTRSRAACLIVSIGYPNGEVRDLTQRALDYTPPLPETATEADRRQYGQADRFAAFLDHELAPALAAKYPVNPKEQALFGHSFGALFGLYSLFTVSDRFKHNLLASPSVWWHNRRVLDFLPSALPTDTAVRISVGEHEGRSNRPEQIGREMVAQAKLLAGTLQHLGADAQFTLYPNANHGNTPFYALPDHIEYLRQAWQKK